MAKQSATGTEMPFLDHLEELRWRIVWSLGALVVALVLAFVLLQQLDIVSYLARPLAPHLGGRKLMFTNPADPFKILLNAAFALGLLLASPVILYQAWAFLSPALYSHEKKLVIPVLIAGVGLFIGGVAFAFYVVLPMTLGFLLGFQTSALEPMITASGYFGFAISMMLMFGLVCELPIVILALAALGVVTPEFLRKYRRHAGVLCIAAAAFITPGGDPTSLFALSLPLYLLFEISVILTTLLYRRRARREAAPPVALDQGGIA